MAEITYDKFQQITSDHQTPLLHQTENGQYTKPLNDDAKVASTDKIYVEKPFYKRPSFWVKALAVVLFIGGLLAIGFASGGIPYLLSLIELVIDISGLAFELYVVGGVSSTIGAIIFIVASYYSQSNNQKKSYLDISQPAHQKIISNDTAHHDNGDVPHGPSNLAYNSSNDDKFIDVEKPNDIDSSKELHFHEEVSLNHSNQSDVTNLLEYYLNDQNNRFIWTNRRYYKTDTNREVALTDLNIYIRKKVPTCKVQENRYKDRILNDSNIPKKWDDVRYICCHQFPIAFVIDAFLNDKSYDVHNKTYWFFHNKIKTQKQVLINFDKENADIDKLDSVALNIGDLIYINGTTHVVMASGKKDEIYSLWTQNDSHLIKTSLKSMLKEHFSNQNIKIQIIRNGLGQLMDYARTL